MSSLNVQMYLLKALLPLYQFSFCLILVFLKEIYFKVLLQDIKQRRR